MTAATRATRAAPALSNPGRVCQEISASGNLHPTKEVRYRLIDVCLQVTIGEEGFFGPGDPHDSCNPGYPGSTWPQQSGQDFTNNHKNKAIDFTVRPSVSWCPQRICHACS